MILSEIIRENMDLSDKDTLKKVVSLKESGQNQFLVALTSKLYDKIQEKATSIDYSTVEASRGDITKIQNYKSIYECLDIMRGIVVEYKETTAPIDTVVAAVKNLSDRKAMFQKAFNIGSSFPILVYNNMALAVVESTSFLISTCIEYIKDPGAETFQMALDTVAYNKTMQNLLFKSLSDFNNSCTNKDLDNALGLIMSKAIARRESADMSDRMMQTQIAKNHPYLTDEDIKNGVQVVLGDVENIEEGFGTAFKATAGYLYDKALLSIAKIFVPFVRHIVYFFYLQKQKISDYYGDMADFLQMNAYNVLQNEEIPEAKRKKIYAEQMKKAEKFRKRSNEMNIDYTTTKRNADKLEADEARKFKAEDIESDNNNDNGDETVEDYGSIFEASITEGIGPWKFESPFDI